MSGVIDPFKAALSDAAVISTMWGNDCQPSIQAENDRAVIAFGQGTPGAIYALYPQVRLHGGESFQAGFHIIDDEKIAAGLTLSQVNGFVGYAFDGFIFERNMYGFLSLTQVNSGRLSSPAGLEPVKLPMTYYLRIAKTGGDTFSFYYSFDGNAYVRYATLTVPEFSAVQVIGFGGSCNDKAPAQAQVFDFSLDPLTGAEFAVGMEEKKPEDAIEDPYKVNSKSITVQRRALQTPMVTASWAAARWPRGTSTVAGELIFLRRAGRDAQTLARKTIEVAAMQNAMAELEFDLQEQPYGYYAVRLQACDAAGTLLGEASDRFFYPPPPLWTQQDHLRKGEEELLAPWTPLTSQVHDDGSVQVECLGRTVIFGNSGLPRSIISQGRELLSEPLLFKSGNAKAEGQLKLLLSTPEKVIVEAENQLGSWRFKVTATMEYDGMMQLRMTSLQAARVADLRLTGTVAEGRDYLRYIRDSEYRQQNFPRNCGLVPAEGYRMEFPYLLWVGNDERGLNFFAEEYGALKLDTALNGGILTPEGENTAFTIHLFDHESVIPADWQFEFGLLATPFKPYPDDDTAMFRVQGDFFGFEQSYVERNGYTGIPPYEDHGVVTYELGEGNDFSAGILDITLSPAPAGPYLTSEQRILAIRTGLVPAFAKRDDTQRMELRYAPGVLKIVNFVNENEVSAIQGEVELVPGRFYRLRLQWKKDALTLQVDGNTVIAAAGRALFPDGDAIDGPSALSVGYLPARVPCQWIIDRLALQSGKVELVDEFDEAITPTGWLTTAAGGLVHRDASFVPGATSSSLALKTYFYDEEVSYFDRMKSWGADVAVWHEMWTPSACGYYASAREEAVKRAIAGARAAGLEMWLYFGCQIPTISHEYLDYGAEMGLIRKGENFRYFDLFDNPTLIPCWGYEPCGNFIVATIVAALENYQMQGIYLDGVFSPEPCVNTLHGHGFYDAQGELQGTVPWFAFRRMARAVYHEVHKRGGTVDVHMSCEGPTAVYADRSWTGEIPAVWAPQANADALRVKFAGRAMGIQAELLMQEGQGYEKIHSLGLQLLLGTPVKRGWYASHYTTMQTGFVASVREFGLKGASFVPFRSKENPFMENLPGEVYASFYRHATADKIMLTVMNLGTEAVEFALPLQGYGQVSDQIFGREFTVRDGKVHLAIAPKDFVCMRLER